MAREIILDTETTGLDPRDHRVIEIACVEIEDFIPTGRTFHRYINPDRPIDEEAERVHGISGAFLADKPRFSDPEICDAFLAFVGDANIVAHNAAFDMSFVAAELVRVGRAGELPEPRWVCTYKLAQKRFPGMYNSLDALCKRYRISLAEREKHGALIDARLLAAVYLELQGGRERALNFAVEAAGAAIAAVKRVVYGPRPRPLAPLSTEAEREAHAAFIAKTVKNTALWARFDPAPAAAAE
jgi:DNA polymerase III subunit epsilon